jgi:uncharacterized protein YbbK (DUF523 family)
VSGRQSRPRVGISACLLGQPVRYDGGHKGLTILTDTPQLRVEWLPVCPEVEAGLGVPRPAMRLEETEAGVRLLEIGSGRDHTRRMDDHAVLRVAALLMLKISGYVLKARSPSCGLRAVPVHRPGAEPRSEGRGLFAQVLVDAYPALPIVEEGEIGTEEALEAFLARVVAYHNDRRRGA